MYILNYIRVYIYMYKFIHIFMCVYIYKILWFWNMKQGLMIDKGCGHKSELKRK